MAAELRLNVALDLQYFKRQLPKLSQAAAGFQLPIQVKFDARQVQRELNRITGRREFRININDTSIKSAIANVRVLQKELAALERTGRGFTGAGVRTGGSTQQGARGTFRQRLQEVDKAELAKLYEAAAIAGLAVFDKAIVNNKAKLVTRLNQAGQDAVLGFINGIKSDDDGIRKAAELLGDELLTSLRKQLKSQSPSKEMFSIGEDAGKGLEIGLIGYLQLIKNRATREMRGIVAAVRFEAMKLGDINFGTRAGIGPSSTAGRAGILPPAGMGRIDLNARQMPTRIPRIASSTGATGAMSMLPSSAIETYSMGRGTQLALPSVEMRAAAAAAKSQERVAEAGKKLRKSLKDAADGIKTSFGALSPGAGIAYGGRNAGYRSPIGPLPLGSAEPWAKSFGAGYMGSGFNPYMQSSVQSLRELFKGVKPLTAPSVDGSLSNFASSQVAKAMQTLGIAGGGGARGPEGRLALPAAGQSTASLAQASKEAAAKVRAYGRSAERAAAVLGENDRVTRGLPSRSTGSALALSSRGAGASGGGGRFGGSFARDAGDVFNNMSAGPIASVAKELKYATSQVLLFGTAYKALAAATALPGNIAKATANLQAFNNQMEAVTGGGEVMASSMKLIEETVARFNIPVQSARDGFVKLYASMQPAGIDLSTINSVFTGLSAAASTFGMSADQVDRMTYALAQMASKGQIMTEELKGQLGDVFPQAVSLFARAAGFLDDTMDEQAKSKGLASFLKALEDGALKGETMSAVLSNVGKLLNTDFGPSADKAANSFQNQINKLNNALTTFYESFAPAAGAFLGEFVDPIVSALSTVGEAVKLAFSDEPLGGNQLAEYLRNELFPQLVSIKDAILAGAQTFALFGQAASVVLRPLSQLILGNQQFVNIVTRAAIVGAVLKAGLVAIRVTGIIPLIRNIVLFNKTFRVFIAQTAAGTKGMTALRAAAVQTGMGMRQAAVGVRILATAIRTVLVSSAIGIALVAISALIEKIMQLKATAESIEAQRGGAGARIRKAAEMGGTEAMNQEQRRVQSEITSRQKSIGILERLSRGESIDRAQEAQLKATGSLPSGLVPGDGDTLTAATLSYSGGGGFKTDIAADVKTVLENNRKSLAAFTEGMDEQMVAAAKNAAVVDKRFKEQSQLSLDGLDLTGGDGTGGKGGKGGKGQEDLSPEMVAIRERLREINRGLLMDQQGVNEFMRIEAELALEIQRIKESDQGTAEKIQDIEDARLEATKKKADVTKREMEKLVERLSEEESARRRIKDIMLESDLASGRITQEEYDRAKHLQSQADKLKEIARLRNEGKITPEAAGAAEASVRANVFKGDEGKVSAWIEKTEKELEDFEGMAVSAADSIASEFGTAFSGILQGTTSLQEGLGNAFKNIGSMFADMVMQMLAKWAMLQVMKGIFGFANGGIVTAGGGAPDAGDAMDGGGVLPMFANGGIVKGPTLGMVGEGRFNEAIVPLPNGKSIPVEMGGSAGSNISTNITVNVNNGQVSSKASGSQGNDLARNLEGAVKQVIMREMQPGGMISSGR